MQFPQCDLEPYKHPLLPDPRLRASFPGLQATVVDCVLLDANLLGSKLAKGIQSNTLCPRNKNPVYSNIKRGRVGREGSRRAEEEVTGSKERSAATLSEGTGASWAAGNPPAGWPGWRREN